MSNDRVNWTAWLAGINGGILGNWEILLQEGRWAISRFKPTGDVLLEHQCERLNERGRPVRGGTGYVNSAGTCCTCLKSAPSHMIKFMDVLEL